MSSHRVRRVIEPYSDWDPYGYYPQYRERLPIRHPDFVNPHPYEVDRLNRRVSYFDVPPSYHLRGFYESDMETTQNRLHYTRHSDNNVRREDECVYQEDEYDEELPERDRPWLPRRSGETGTSSADEARRVKDPKPVSTSASSVVPIKMSKESCKELSILLANIILTESSKAIAKEFPLAFKDESFSI